MTQVEEIPDIEDVVTTYLEDLDFRVVNETPADVSTAWVKVIQFNARTIGNRKADYAQNFYLQIDCYSNENGPEGQEEASTLRRQVRAAIATMPNVDDLDAAISEVVFTRDQRNPDEDFKPPRQRYQLDVTITAHGIHSES